MNPWLPMPLSLGRLHPNSGLTDGVQVNNSGMSTNRQRCIVQPSTINKLEITVTKLFCLSLQLLLSSICTSLPLIYSSNFYFVTIILAQFIIRPMLWCIIVFIYHVNVIYINSLSLYVDIVSIKSYIKLCNLICIYYINQCKMVFAVKEK